MEIKKILKRYGRLADKLGLVWGTSGNMSVRIDEDRFLITASGATLRKLQDEDIVVCKISNDFVKGKPSMEFRMHKEIYQLRKKVMAVLHSQPFFSTLVACSNELAIKKEIIPESIVYLKKIERIPYQHPGSSELALQVGKKVKTADILLLENHGVVCVGGSIQEVINKTLTLEFLCKLTIFSKAANIELKAIDRQKVIDFLDLLNKDI